MILPIMVFLPIAAAIIAFPLFKKSTHTGNIFVTAVAAAEFVLALSLFLGTGASTELTGFCALGLRFVSGSLRSVMALIASFMWLMTALASPEYFAHGQRNERYYCFYLWTLGAIIGVFLALDLMTLFIFFEMMSFTSYVWVVQNETPEAIRAAETYLFIAVIGGLTMLMGLFLLYSSCGTLTPDNILSAIASMSMTRRLTVGICILIGFGAKAGMFPVHIWLPKAHPVAPAPASALLSGILTKSGVFGIVAISCWMFEGTAVWGNILLVPAAITMLLGAVLAVFSTDLKRTLACSSMSQIGFILTGVSMRVLLSEHGSIAAAGTTLHILNHSLIKLTLFVAAGVVYLNTHSLDLNAIRGFGKGKKLLTLAFLFGACSIAGIPGFSGYISKTLLHESIVEYTHILHALGASVLPYKVLEWVFLISGGLTLAYMARLFYIIFIAEKNSAIHERDSKYMALPTAIVLGIGGLLMPLLGLTAHFSMDKLATYASDFFHCHPLEHSVHYFSFENLKGALISIAIGTAVFLLVGMRMLTRRENGEEKYLNLWPKTLDLEDRLYRPLLKVLSFVGAVFARLVETIGAVLIYGTVDLMLMGSKREVKLELDDFSDYSRQSKRSSVQRSFSFDLLATALGITALFVLVLLKLV